MTIKKKKKISPPDRGEFKTSIYVYMYIGDWA